MIPRANGGAGKPQESWLDWAAGYVPSPVKSVSRAAVDVATAALSYLVSPADPSTGVIATYKPKKTHEFYTSLQEKAMVGYEKGALLEALYRQPNISKVVAIQDYLEKLSAHKTTHKIYQKLRRQWGYGQFFRIGQSGIKGLVHGFLAYVLFEDAPTPRSPIFERLCQFYQAHSKLNLIPTLKEALPNMTRALSEGEDFVHGIFSSDPSIFLDTLTDALLITFYSKEKQSEIVSLPDFLKALPLIEPVKRDLLSTYEALRHPLIDPKLSSLVSLLGPKQSFLAHNPASKWSFISGRLPDILKKTKTKLLADKLIPDRLIEWFETVNPRKLLSVFDSPEAGISRENQLELKPIFLRVYQDQLFKDLSENRGLLLEGFEVVGTNITELVGHLCQEITQLEGAFVEKCVFPEGGAASLLSLANLTLLAEQIENYEQYKLDYLRKFFSFLYEIFDVSFVIHSWEASYQKRRRLQIDQVGNWNAPTCHLLLFPEAGSYRVDLLKSIGTYASRASLSDLVRSAQFKHYKRHGSETLASLSQDPKVPLADRVLASNILYFRLHLFACLHRLFVTKIPLLKTDHFDLKGAKEDDEALLNPYGPDYSQLLPTFNTEFEKQLYRLEKHIGGLNREIAELLHLIDCVFSQTVHSSIVRDIQTYLGLAKPIIKEFHFKRIPQFLKAYDDILEAQKTQAQARIRTLQGMDIETFRRLNPEKLEEFRRLISDPSLLVDPLSVSFPKTSKEGILTADELHVFESFIAERGPLHILASHLKSLIPRLEAEQNPPPVFKLISEFKIALERYKNAAAKDPKAVALHYSELHDAIVLYEKFFTEGLLTRQLPLFRTLFSPERKEVPFVPALEIIHAKWLDELIDKTAEFASQSDLQKLNKKLREFKTCRALLKEVSERTTPELFAALKAKQGTIAGLKEAFISINPTKAKLFDSLFVTKPTLDINPSLLKDLLVLPIDPREDTGIYLELKNLLDLVKSHQAYIKETYNLYSCYKIYMAATSRGGAFMDVTVERDLDDAGSLGDDADDRGSVGGASYSSDRDAMGASLTLIPGRYAAAYTDGLLGVV